MANDVHTLEIYGSLCGQPTLGILHYEAGVASSPSPVVESGHLIAGWQAAMEATYLACLPQNYTLIGYKSRRVNNTGGPHYIATAVAAVGTVAVDASNSALAPCVIFSYTDGVHWHSGRHFMPGIADTWIDNNALTAPAIAAYNTLNGLWGTPIANSGDTFQFGIWSVKNSAFYQVLAEVVSGKPGIQNRRLRPTF